HRFGEIAEKRQRSVTFTRRVQREGRQQTTHNLRRVRHTAPYRPQLSREFPEGGDLVVAAVRLACVAVCPFVAVQGSIERSWLAVGDCDWPEVPADKCRCRAEHLRLDLHQAVEVEHLGEAGWRVPHETENGECACHNAGGNAIEQADEVAKA